MRKTTYYDELNRLVYRIHSELTNGDVRTKAEMIDKLLTAIMLVNEELEKYDPQDYAEAP